MKKIGFIVIGTLLILGLSIWWIGIDTIIIKMIKPNHDFVTAKIPPAPDYSRTSNWAALPEKEDFADFRPADIVAGDTALQAVDVFFIHPTGYFLGKLWNEPLDLSTGTAKKTNKLMANNASIFNDCKVYAPRYRQATIVTFLNMDGENEQQALALAYQDVKRAFLYFLENYNKDRPFILAGHSQGSYHGKLLIEELIDNKPLAQKMVAAYLLGTTDITNDWTNTLSDISVCDSPTQTNCLINFNTYADNIKPSEEWGKKHVVCVNPLSWRRNGAHTDKTEHLGYVLETGDKNIKFFGADTPDDKPIAPLQAPLIAHTHATCENGVLLIENQQLDIELEKGNYHGIELSLFHMNIRANVAERSRAYFLKKSVSYDERLLKL